MNEAAVDLQMIIPAIELAKSVTRRLERDTRSRKSQYRPSALFGPSVARALMLVEDGEDGNPEDSDSDVEEHDDDPIAGSYYCRWRDNWTAELD